MILLNVVLPLVGFGIIVAAFLGSKRFSVLPVAFEFGQIKLKSNTFTTLVLVGIIAIGFGAYSWIHGYDAQIQDYQDELTKWEAKKEMLEGMVEKFKLYNLRFKLAFPGQNETAPPQIVKVQAYVSRLGEEASALCSSDLVPDLRGNPWVKIESLNQGDQLRIIVYDQEQNIWENAYEVVVPKMTLPMKRVSR